MRKTKVHGFLKNCNETQLEKLNLHVHAPGIKSEIQLLYDAFVLHLQDENFSKENIYKSVFKQKKFDGNTFRKACHELLKILEEKIVFTYITENKEYSKLLQLYNYSQHGWLSQYDDLHKEINEIKNPASYKMQVEQLHYMHLIRHPPLARQNTIANYSTALDDFYLLEKMKLICHSQNEKQFTKFDYKPEYSNHLLKLIQDKSKNNLLLNCYFTAYKMLENINETRYFELLKKELLREKEITTEDKKILFQYIINFCIIRINKSDTAFERELFEVFKLYYEQISETEISPFRFKNVINLSLKLKEYTYAEYFNTTFGELLDVSIRDSTIIFNQAKIAFEMKQYDTTLMLLNKARFDDLTFNLSSRILITKTFYEQKEMQFLENYLESFRIYILRNKAMNTSNKKLHQDFIKLIRQLMRKEYAGKKQTEAFKQKINVVPNLPDKVWILEKVEEL